MKALAALLLIALVALGAVFALNQKAPDTRIVINTNFAQAPAVSSEEPQSVEITAYTVTNPRYYYGNNPYANGLGLVKEMRKATLPEGPALLSLKSTAAGIFPTSIYFKDLSDAGTTVLEQNYDYDLVSQDKLLGKYIDREIVVKTGDNETIRGVLLSAANGLVLQTLKGITTLSGYKQIEYPALPEGLLTTPTITWQLLSQKAGAHDIQLSYLTTGINWNADYVAVANKEDDALDLRGWVSVKNDAGTTFRDAKLKLVAGDINLVQEGGLSGGAMKVLSDVSRSYEQPQFTEEGLFEYHLYTLQRPTTLKNGEMKQVTLFNSYGVPAEKEFVFDGSRNAKVQVKLNFKNEKGKGLGIPMPKGKVRLYKPDSEGQLQFLGEDAIDHTPADEMVRLYIGNAFDVIGERKEMNHQGSYCSYVGTYQIVLRNHKKEDIVATAVERPWGTWSILSSTLDGKPFDYKKESAHEVVWKVPVKANGNATLEYTATMSC